MDWFGGSEDRNKQFSITKRSVGDGATIAPAATESLNPTKGITIQATGEVNNMGKFPDFFLQKARGGCPPTHM